MAPAVPVQKRKGHRNGGREAHPRGAAGILRPRSCCLPVDPPYPFSILETPLLAKKGVTAHIIKRLGCLQALAQIFLFLPYYQSAFLSKGHEMDRGRLIFVIIHCLKHFN